MRAHLYEFHAEKRRLKCLCGWERTVKKADVASAYEMFSEHCAEQRLLSR